jgi:enoyl-CoA hydratase/carnithine racemase
MAAEQSFGGGGLQASCTDMIGRIVITQPAQKNAVNAAMWSDMPSALDWLVTACSARVIVISGHGSDFSAGADISEFASVRHDRETSRAYDALNAEAFRAIRTTAVPTIAAISGICYGGGFGIAAACDLRLADSTARFCVPAARLGLAYPLDAIGDIVSAAGVQAAKWMLFTAGVVDAQRGLELGLLVSVVDQDLLAATAMEMAATIAANAPLTVQASKAGIRAALSQNWDDLDRAEKLGQATFDSADYAEGRLAFAERRQPRFIGA